MQPARQRSRQRARRAIGLTASAIRRLHLGAGDLLHLAQPELAPLIDPSWTHLGSELSPTVDWDRYRSAGLPALIRGWLTVHYYYFRLFRHLPVRRRVMQKLYESLRRRSNFVPFSFRKGERLEFDDGSFDFIFSEHFLEHLFLDDAAALLAECRRLLKPSGCLRTVVPDADLRTYEAPEPVGFTTEGMAWTDPGKHKTRWSIYSLSWVLEQQHLRPRGVVYCDKEGGYHHDPPESDDPFYSGCTDLESIVTTRYVRRFRNSLVVDARTA